MADHELVQRAKHLVDRLSQKPRFAGSPEEAAARVVCRSELERAGFVCTEKPLEYSQWPGKWGVPSAAVLQTATILLVARVATRSDPLIALVIGAVLYVALTFATADAKRRWITRLPVQRAKSVNLEAGRGNPTVWLVAHLDSKSQTVPMLIRIASSVGMTAVTIVAAVVLLLSLPGDRNATTIWRVIESSALIVALPSILCWVRNGSRGAVDNASGVAAVLLAAQSLSSPRDLGVLITSGEELGLAGARVWAARAQPGIVALNCDTVDDVGAWRLMHSGPLPPRIGAAARLISSSTVPNLAIGRMVPGILADSMAFADRGIEAVTLSRGALSTLARIHTRRDNSNELTGNGVADASMLLTALTKELA
ncbi:MAG: M28 family peptidase [Gemmatimonadota bacterium]|nr:M28 family peptidase [Gemmatimonadota bacterium]